MNIQKTEKHIENRGSIYELGAAIERALDEEPALDVMSVLAGAFIGLTVELVRRQGHDVTKEIKVNGGQHRDITIHPPKEPTTDFPRGEQHHTQTELNTLATQ